MKLGASHLFTGPPSPFNVGAPSPFAPGSTNQGFGPVGPPSPFAPGSTNQGFGPVGPPSPFAPGSTNQGFGPVGPPSPFAPGSTNQGGGSLPGALLPIAAAAIPGAGPITGALKAVGSLFGGGGNRTGYGGVGAPSPYGPPPPSNKSTTVSPAFQQDFNAQVSPSIIAQIDSAGASATGAPSQQRAGGQDARGGSSRTGNPSGGFGQPFQNQNPFQNSYPGSYPSAFRDPFSSPILQRQTSYTGVITTGIIAVAALAGLVFWSKSKK